jgi:hypothetical protein
MEQLEQITRISAECDVPVVPTVNISPDLRETKLPLPVPPIEGATVITPDAELELVKVCLTGEANTTWVGLGPNAGEWDDNQYSATVTFPDGTEVVDGALVTNVNQSVDDDCQILRAPYKCYLGRITGETDIGEDTVTEVDIAAEVPGMAFPSVLVRITSEAAGGGIYIADMYAGESGTPAGATGLSMGTNPTSPTQLACGVLVLNLAENGQDTHILAYDTWLPGILVRNQDDEDKVVVVYASPLPQATSAGDMIYWDGTKWVTLSAPGSGDFVLMFGSGAPYWQQVQEFVCPGSGS